MKRRYFFLVGFFLIVCAFSSCSMEKRLYRPGFYKERNSKSMVDTAFKNKLAITGKKNEPITISPDTLIQSSPAKIREKPILVINRKIIAATNSIVGHLDVDQQKIIRENLALPPPNEIDEVTLNEKSLSSLLLGIGAFLGALLAISLYSKPGEMVLFGLALLILSPIIAIAALALGVLALNMIGESDDYNSSRVLACCGLVFGFITILIILAFTIQFVI